MVPDNNTFGDPYHGLRRDVSSCQTAEEVLCESGLEEPIRYEPVYIHTEGDGEITPCVFEEFEGFKRPVRGDNNIPAIVQSTYTGLGDDKILGALQLFVDQFGAEWKSVSVTQQTAHVIAELSLPQGSFSVERHNGMDDKFECSIMSLWGHHGLKGWMGGFLERRLFCFNQLAGLVAGENWFKFRHTKNIELKIPTAQKVIAQAMEHFQAKQRGLQTLANAQLNQHGFVEFCAQLITGEDNPTEAMKLVTSKDEGRSKARMEHKFDVLANLYLNGKGNFGHDCLDALNAVTEWCDWGRGAKADEDALVLEATARRIGGQSTPTQRSELVDDLLGADGQEERAGVVDELVLTDQEHNRLEKRFHSNLSGSGAELKHRAWELLTSRAQAVAA